MNLLFISNWMKQTQTGWNGMGRQNLSNSMQNVKDTSSLDPSQCQQVKHKIKKLKEINDASQKEKRSRETLSTGSQGSLWSAAWWCGECKVDKVIFWVVFQARLTNLPACSHWPWLVRTASVPRASSVETFGLQLTLFKKPVMQFTAAGKRLLPFAIHRITDSLSLEKTLRITKPNH